MVSGGAYVWHSFTVITSHSCEIVSGLWGRPTTAGPDFLHQGSTPSAVPGIFDVVSVFSGGIAKHVIIQKNLCSCNSNVVPNSDVLVPKQFLGSHSITIRVRRHQKNSHAQQGM